MLYVADNLNAMNPVVARALADRQAGPVQDLVRGLIDTGVQLIDVNPGHLSRRRVDAMAFLVEAVQAVTDLPLVLDSPQPEVLAAGIATCRVPPLLNALTLEPHRLRGTLSLAAENGLDLVLLLLDERSAVPGSVEEKVAVALQLVQAAGEEGLDPARLIIDPVVPSLSWPDAEAQLAAAVEVVRLVAGGELLGEPLRTMAGVSNLRSGLHRQVPLSVEQEALGRLKSAGLHYSLLNPRRHRALLAG